MNANGRRVRQANNGYRHLSRLNGVNIKGGRPMYPPTAGLSVAELIARERRRAAAEQARKKKSK